MRFILFLSIFVLFSTLALASGGGFFFDDWWNHDQWEQEEPAIIQKSPPLPQQNIQQQQKSFESIQERIKKLRRLLEEKRDRQAPLEYKQRKK